MLPNAEPIQRRVIWSPIPNSSQEIAIDTRCHHTLYTGTRGPGKTDCQLMRFRRRVGVGYGSFWRGIIFDREYKHLDDIVAKAKRWFNRFDDGAKFLESTSHYKWTWPTGEELLFRVIKEIGDYDNYHGQEYPYIGWNELTKHPTSELYDMMMSCNRSSFTPDKDGPRNPQSGMLICVECGLDERQHERIKDHQFRIIESIPLEVFSTTNSFGVGHHWVKQRFIDPAPYGKVVRTTVNVFNPRSQKEAPITRTQVAIFGSYKENIYLDPAYIAGLMDMCKNNENLRKSWLEGDWEVVAGGAIDDVWRKHIHILPRFKIPSSWYIDRTFDWGSTHPFSVGWWAEANGDEATLPICGICGIHETGHQRRSHVFEAKKFCPKPGSLIQLGEWYGTSQIGSNKGLKLSGKDVAIGIKQREIEFLEDGWIPYQPWAGPADNQISDVRESDVDTIEKKMSDNGIRWQKSEKSPGSRRNGLQLIRDRLEAAMTDEGPALYFMDNCRASIITIPVLPRDEDKMDDVDTSAEDHPYDMVRYRVLKGNNRLAKQIQTKWVH